MKKRVMFCVIMVLVILNLSACGCKHEWKVATCKEPKTCTLCGKTEGEPTDHTWTEATCTTPKTCSVCGKTEGEPLGHTWEEATCTEPKTCSVCGATEGEALGHTWIEATYTEPKTCSVCGATEGTVLEKPAYENMPEGLSVNETEWENWESENSCDLFSFMDAGTKANYEFTLPMGQDEHHKVVSFIFDDNGEMRNLEDADMYYGVINQQVLYTGLCTEDEDVYESDDFKEACIRLMLSYNVSYDDAKGDVIFNLTRERAEEIVNFCFDNDIEHCVVDGMRIRLLREKEDNYYSFHIEY